MKNIFFLIVIGITTVTNVYSQEFKLKNYTFDIDHEIIGVAYCNSEFYCLESDGKVFSIDSILHKKTIANAPISSTSIVSINDSLFVRTKNDSTFYLKNNKFSFTKRKNDFPFFEDDKYIVEKSCSGEWGGSIYFIDKSDKKKYECASTCPIIVNKLNETYIITASLAHMAGSTQILKIDDPKALTLFKKRKRKKINYVGDDESKTTIGSEIIVDSVGVMVTTSFLYERNLFHIVTGNQGTSLCKIENNEFEEIAKISDDRFWSYNPINVRYSEGKTLSVFRNNNSNGFLFIKENNVTIYSFYKKKKILSNSPSN